MSILIIIIGILCIILGLFFLNREDDEHQKSISMRPSFEKIIADKEELSKSLFPQKKNMNNASENEILSRAKDLIALKQREFEMKSKSSNVPEQTKREKLDIQIERLNRSEWDELLKSDKSDQDFSHKVQEQKKKKIGKKNVFFNVQTSVAKRTEETILYDKITELEKLNFSTAEIAKKLNRGVREIEFIKKVNRKES